MKNFVLAFLLSLTFAQADDRPNILFLFADDWGRHASIYAETDGPGTVNDAIQTPNFDQLAREGVLFQNAFVSAPSCTPCRSSLLSGQHFWRTGAGAILKGATWDDSIPTYPLLLEKEGYHLGYTYKVWSPGTPKDAPIGGARTGYRKAGASMNAFSQTVTKLMAGGMLAEEAMAKPLTEARKNFQQFLAAREEGTPFCYWFGPTNVHRKWIKGRCRRFFRMCLRFGRT